MLASGKKRAQSFRKTSAADSQNERSRFRRAARRAPCPHRPAAADVDGRSEFSRRWFEFFREKT